MNEQFLVQVTAPHYCAAFTVVGSGEFGRVAPILRWAPRQGWSPRQLYRYVRRKGFKVHVMEV